MADAPASPAPARPTQPGLTTAVMVHLAVLLLGTTWGFGGQAPWVREFIAWWGGVGVILFMLAVRAHPAADGQRSPVRLLWPLWVYDALVAISCFNPGLRETMVAGEPSLVVTQPIAWLPSAAVPRLAARELWQFNALVLSVFAACLVFHRRGQLRRLLYLSAGNALALAIFGTFQKLAGAKGLWFGLVVSPNEHFFATFIYHNHWGAYCLLNLAACLGLLFHHERRGGHRDFWHSPVLLGAVATLLLATSIPLSTSRSCTVLAALLLLAALLHVVRRVVRHRRAAGRRVAAPVGAIIAAAVLAAAAVAFLGRGVIAERSRLTAEQLDTLAREKTLTSRLVLYGDTWRMARAKPWFGWGLESYARVFRIFNTQRATEQWVWIPFYAEAHNDWLQSIAEVGFVGTALLVLLGARVVATVRWRRVGSVLPRYLGGGCAIVLLYAWVEFPFANPAVLLTFLLTGAVMVRYAQLDPAQAPHE